MVKTRRIKVKSIEIEEIIMTKTIITQIIITIKMRMIKKIGNRIKYKNVKTKCKKVLRTRLIRVLSQHPIK